MLKKIGTAGSSLRFRIKLVIRETASVLRKKLSRRKRKKYTPYPDDEWVREIAMRHVAFSSDPKYKVGPNQVIKINREELGLGYAAEAIYHNADGDRIRMVIDANLRVESVWVKKADKRWLKIPTAQQIRAWAGRRLDKLEKRLYRWRVTRRLVELVIVRRAIRATHSAICEIANVASPGEEDASHIALLASTLAKLENVRTGRMSLTMLDWLAEHEEPEHHRAWLRLQLRLKEIKGYLE
jgi:hypothetical protein